MMVHFQNKCDIAIIEDEPVVQNSLKELIESQPGMSVSLTAFSVEEFLQQLASSGQSPDILLLDINLPGMSGLDGIPYIRNKVPDLDIIILTTLEERDMIFKALCLGACSYLSKQSSIDKIIDAILVVKNGGSYMSPTIARKVVEHFSPISAIDNLSPRQRQVVQGIISGKSYKLIAADLFISVDTVRSHIKFVYKALQVNSKAELISKASGWRI